MAEVTLTGTVDSREAKRRAEDCAEAISGVKNVQNNLRVQGRRREHERQGELAVRPTAHRAASRPAVSPAARPNRGGAEAQTLSPMATSAVGLFSQPPTFAIGRLLLLICISRFSSTHCGGRCRTTTRASDPLRRTMRSPSELVVVKVIDDVRGQLTQGHLGSTRTLS